MTILQRIKSHYDTNSNKQKMISDYLLQNYGNIPFMSLNELSKTLNVSEVTLIKYCKALELQSFKELKKEFKLYIKEKLAVPSKMKTTLEEFESVEDAYHNALQVQKMNLDGVVELNPLSAFVELAELMIHSRNVYLCGHCVSLGISVFLQERLRSLGINANVLKLDDFSVYGYDVINASKDDLFVLISYPKYSTETVQLKKFLEHNEKTYVAITDADNSPIAGGAKVVLKSENRSLLFYNFISASFSLLEVFLTILGYQMKDELLPNIKEIMKCQMNFFNNKNNI